MLSSVLIANRGEIARRIIRTARELGVRTIAVYSEADANAPFVMEADAAILIGPAPAKESYLDPRKILAAARQMGAEAIHPGYGFLSENAEFAQSVIDAGLVWIGPPPSAIRAMGLKDAAKAVMIKAGVPTTPGYLGEDQSVERLTVEAAKIGYPVLIKAVAGGGGKGMRKVERAEDFEAALGSCRREASAAFGDDRVLLEKYVTRPRHIEVQVFGDSHGNVVHLFERDCSLQRRHQKVIEEAPAPGMDEATREAVCAAAVKAAQAVNYVGAGTVEFIADASEGLRADRIWFMEMNTRLQVEHPVTEMVTGQDLVEWQLRVASGEPLPLEQDEITLDGWAMEARLYAENPATGFLPSTGKLKHFRLPEGDVRVDSAVEEGGEVTPFYDPMIAKLIAHGADREDAAQRLAEACALVEVWPVKTNAAFLAKCASHPDFVDGAVDTGFIEARLDELTERVFSDEPAMAAIGWRLDSFLEAEARRDPWEGAPSKLLGFRMNAPRASMHLPMSTDGKATPLRVALIGGGTEDWSWDIRHADGRAFDEVTRLPTTYGKGPIQVFEGGDVQEFDFVAKIGGAGEGGASDGAILSPMPGKIVSVAVSAGQTVSKGQTLLTLEAMKMEHAMAAPFDGVVAELSAVAGGQVSEGVVLARLEPAVA
ncbi:acetyl/propionyl/methylcrotonyl-CoA carboxylase subunit alpha [Caulobacter vibrioides]|uniref:acetyl/propionyl/methylcrotonyl-CoA carboxylase subunit alpha n=1 Tax=Caulobacter vibrioides TaxID=155892 RepID=UPI000BB470AF|nr:acetyl/propionyl/methylcrotonyl-CoA carboxylase subunit alpha [Caulobacter vibrioides]ATC26766.1 acetyl/propionyl/methylcrotonyl-CoA carboxylase subunit alpha [Caulobacter vibrioides]AZH13272.1 acetyl/propionyl/methylcrotonyl-CoA carboxylase subunit alpha [Caulobacter vibrioides]PLR09935.1 acetyl/propionyl/methylcrotonyl-CoA carboxylase subunit alpha [Caulobacter vibrioides]